MKLVALVCGITLFSYPLVADVDNSIVAIFFFILGAACLGLLKDQSRVDYLGTRKTHFFKVRK